MKVAIAILTSLHLFARFASAHPFIIINPNATPVVAVAPPAPTHHYVARQNLLDDLTNAANSLLGISSSASSSTKKKSTTTISSSSASVRTIAPPVTASATTSSTRQRPTTSTDSDSTTSDTSTSTDDSSSTSTSSSSSSSTTSTSSTSSTSSTPTASPTGSTAQPSAAPSTSNDNGGGVPPGGIAVAVIFSILAVLVTIWLLFRYHPRCQAWWAAREAKKYQERSYRDAIDGRPPGESLRSQAMGGGMSRRQTILKSFFAPPTVKLGDGQEIRRKPVNWGADSTYSPSVRAESPTPPLPPPPPQYDMEKIPVDSEKIPMTADAAPMGQIERYSNSYMLQPRQSQQELKPTVPEKIAELPDVPPKVRSSAVSPMSMRANEDLERLPPISPLTHRPEVERSLPQLPPVPSLPALHAKRGSDGVFRLT